MTIKQPNETWCCSECGYSSKMLKASIISRRDFTVKYVSFIAQTGSHWRITWTENTEKREIIICSNIFLDFNFLINFKMSKVLSDAGQVWRCDKCLYKSKYKNNLMELVKSKHVKSPGIINQFLWIEKGCEVIFTVIIKFECFPLPNYYLNQLVIKQIQYIWNK